MNVTRHPLCIGLDPNRWAGIPVDESAVNRLAARFAAIPLDQFCIRFVDMLCQRIPVLRDCSLTIRSDLEALMSTALTDVMTHLSDRRRLDVALTSWAAGLARLGLEPQDYDILAGTLVAAMLQSTATEASAELNMTLDDVREWADTLGLMMDLMTRNHLAKCGPREDAPLPDQRATG